MSRRIILFLLVIAIIIMTPVVSVADSDDNNSDMRAQSCCYSPNIAYIVYQTGIPVTSVGNESLR